MPSRTNSGFSLLELVLVILILGSLAAIAGVRLGAGITSDRMTVTARDLAATLRLARDRAALTGLQQRVVLTFGTTPKLRAEEEADALDKPGEWSNPGLSWTQSRTLHSSLRWVSCVLDPDEEDLREEFDGLSAEGEGELAIRFEPDGPHHVYDIGDEDQGGDDARVVEIKIASTKEEEQPFYLRIENSGRVRVLSQASREEEAEKRNATR
jgi:prepilin-type N-terminal cleavage/methylation domain-containing protein